MSFRLLVAPNAHRTRAERDRGPPPGRRPWPAALPATDPPAPGAHLTRKAPGEVLGIAKFGLPAYGFSRERLLDMFHHPHFLFAGRNTQRLEFEVLGQQAVPVNSEFGGEVSLSGLRSKI